VGGSRWDETKFGPLNPEGFLKMENTTAKPKSLSGAIVRRRRTAVAAFRRDRRVEDDTRAVPDWGRIVLRSSSTTLR
jgi:hypothetical protein